MTVIDYFSRYLLAMHLSPSFDAASLIVGIEKAKAEAEKIHGPLVGRPTLVTDNGTSFLSRRFEAHIAPSLDHVRTRYRTPEQLGSAGAIPSNPQGGGGVLAPLWLSAGRAREARGIPSEVQRDPSALGVGARSWCDPVTPQEVYGGKLAVQLPAWQGWAKAAKEKLEKLHGGQELQVAIVA